MTGSARRSGAAAILAMLFIAIFATLAVALATLSNNTLLKSENHVAVQGARFQAEGGLNYLVHTLKTIDLPPGAEGQDLLDAVANHYVEQLGNSPAMQGTIQNASGTITIPAFATLGSPGCFDACVFLVNPSTVHIRVTGHHDSVARSVGINFGKTSGASGIFDYGIAARGPIRMTGNAAVEGYNDPQEATCLSATYGTDEAFKLTGNCDLEGGVSVANPDGHVTITGNVTVGEDRYQGSHTIDKQTIENDPDAYSAFKIGVGDVEFPEVNPGVFTPFATNLVDGSTNTSGNKTFTNIRIAANSNKTFSGNITLKGVIFIEQPNRIHFSGNVTITGVIVTEDAGEDNYLTNTIKFTGNTVSHGVEELPNTSEFAQLRDLTGSFLLAPGFGVEFAGNFGTINGTMAADKFKWTGNAGGIVRGSVISYSDDEFKLTGNSKLRIDRSNAPDVPAGFAVEITFTPLPDSYVEY